VLQNAPVIILSFPADAARLSVPIKQFCEAVTMAVSTAYRFAVKSHVEPLYADMDMYSYALPVREPVSVADTVLPAVTAVMVNDADPISDIAAPVTVIVPVIWAVAASVMPALDTVSVPETSVYAVAHAEAVLLHL
jgi:hypothetical protein